jgi:hypothetical protein
MVSPPLSVCRQFRQHQLQEIGRYAPVIPALKVGIPADIGHGGQEFGQRAAPWSERSRRQDGAVLGLGAVAMGSGLLF